eukprot:gnl/TRDRNA2_/TRDRNA2_206388_c0_seq1.p1 gnl/TRDRNA2_/TRDRNA2_206388_c0~~gnl/TRDRNA2_/TRDRNA2_206388_c0_seq1.p1  ORF type:complete len:279 (-),score=20.04 gnl/TRDRNA2_/TRDRNA2_206388_c0_seq1:14-811(-)
MAPMPVAAMVSGFAAVNVARIMSARPPRFPSQSARGGAGLLALRLIGGLIVLVTMMSSYLRLAGTRICSQDDVPRCMMFDGELQFSTFTRWSWVVLGCYLLLAAVDQLLPERHRRLLSPPLAVLSEVSLACAVLVTLAVYLVILPAVLLIEQPASRAGHVAVATAPEAHVMHAANSALAISDRLLAPPRAPLAVPFAWVTLYSSVYVAYAWSLHHRHGIWWYPFLDWNRPYAEAIYAAVYLSLFLIWCLSQRLSGWNCYRSPKVA